MGEKRKVRFLIGRGMFGSKEVWSVREGKFVSFRV